MSHQSTPRFVQWVPAIIIVLLVGFYAWSMVYSVLVLDSSRDLYRASQISQFQRFPLLGPDIGGFFHTGPLWFYLLAMPAVFGSLKLVALFVGVLAGLKFVFAYQLGRELISHKFGLTWALMLLLPGWQVLSQAFINHTNLLEALSLLFLLLLLRWYKSGEGKYGLMSALILGLGFHSHPVFLVLVVFYWPLIWQRKIQYSLAFLLWAVVLFLLPLLPYLMGQILSGFPDWIRFVEYDVLENQIKASGSVIDRDVSLWLHWLQNIAAIMLGGPNRIITFVTNVFPLLGSVLSWLFGLVMFVSLVGFGWVVVKDAPHRRVVVSLLVLLLSAVLLISLLRDFTPFYMLLPLTALFHGLLAFGWYSIINRFRQGLSYALLPVFVVMGTLPHLALQKMAIHGQISFGSVMDVNAVQPKDWVKQKATLDVLRVNESKLVANYFCGEKVVLNGPLSAVLDVSGALPMYFYCDQYILVLGGGFEADDRAVFVMHKSFWQQVKIEPQQWISKSWGATQNYKNHGLSTGLKPAVFDDYVHPPRSDHKSGLLKTYELKINSKAKSYLVISNILPFNVRFQVDDITANNSAVELVVANAANRLYHCANCQNEPITWRLSLTSNDINAIDINTLEQ